MPVKPEFVELIAPERKRTYVFAGAEKLTFTNVTKVAVSTRGTHRLECDEGRVIVPPTWLCIILDMDDWTF